LLHEAIEVPAAAAGAGAMVDDVANLVGSIADRGIDVAGVVLVAAPRQAITLKLCAGPAFDLPVLVGSGLDDGLVAVIAPIGLASALGSPRIEASRAGLVQYASSAVDSAFQQDLLSLRVVTSGAWAVEPGAVAFIERVNWGRAAAPARTSGARHER